MPFAKPGRDADGQYQLFAGIPNLRDARAKVFTTPAQMQEIARCAMDPIYFMETYVWINSLDDGHMLFKLRHYQKDLIKRFVKYRNHIVMYPRQSGKSTITRGFLLWYILFNKGKVVGILSNKLNSSQEQMQLLRESYVQLPFWMQPGVTGWSKRKVALGNGTRIECAPTSVDGIRGMSLNCLYIDEFAHLRPNLASEFITSVMPTLSSGKTTKLIMTSTPNGMNHFYDQWQNGVYPEETDPDTDLIVKSEVKWYDIPGRDEKWKQSQITKLGGSMIRWNQEFECAFIGSISTLIDYQVLNKMRAMPPLTIPGLDPRIRIYEHPVSPVALHHNDWEYVAVIDTGYGDRSDSSVLNISLVKSDSDMSQVAVFSANDMGYAEFAKSCYYILKRYHNPRLIIENNGPGLATIEVFMQLEYDNLMHFDPNGIKLGLWATVNLKQRAVLLLKSAIETARMKIRDKITIDELKSFGRLTKEKWGARGSGHDDHVTVCYYTCYYVMSPLYYGRRTLSMEDGFYQQMYEEMAGTAPAPALSGMAAAAQGGYVMETAGGSVYEYPDGDDAKEELAYNRSFEEKTLKAERKDMQAVAKSMAREAKRTPLDELKSHTAHSLVKANMAGTKEDFLANMNVVVANAKNALRR